MRSYAELIDLINRRGVHAELGPVGAGWGIEQNPHELALLLIDCQREEVKTVLELGTGYKGGLARFLVEDMGYKVTSVDHNRPTFIQNEVQYIAMSTEAAFELVHLNNYDLVIVDASHDYDNVKRDFEMYYPLAGKIIATHDIAGDRNCDGARVYWQEFKESYTGNGLHEAIAQGRNRAGLGWVIKGQDTYEQLTAHNEAAQPVPERKEGRAVSETAGQVGASGTVTARKRSRRKSAK